MEAARGAPPSNSPLPATAAAWQKVCFIIIVHKTSPGRVKMVKMGQLGLSTIRGASRGQHDDLTCSSCS